MKVLLISWVDLGGVNYKTAQALRSAGVEVVQLTFKTHLGYPVETYINPNKPSGKAYLDKMLAWADVVQVQEFWMKAASLGILEHPCIVYHPLGTTHRRSYAEANAWMDKYCSGAYCSEITAYFLGGGRFKYIESPYPESTEKVSFSLPLKVIHAPTSARRFSVKNTPIVKAAFAKIKSPAQLVLVHDQNNQYCMKVKRACNVLIDQPGCFGGGMNSIEAWSMGMPVISGFSGSPVGTRKWREIAHGLYGEIPFLVANGNGGKLVNEVVKAVGQLTDPDTWNHWSQVGTDYFHRFHEEKEVGRQLAEFFRSAL